MQFGMVCDEAWKKPLVTSMYMLGLLIGNVICGITSDA